LKTYSSYFGTATTTGDIERTINNSLADNLTWGMEMVNDAIRYLVAKYYFNERSYTFSTEARTQFYNLPPQVKKLINVTVNIGGTLWQPKECPSREYWDNLNVINFQQNYPSYFFVYNGQMGLFPIPSSSATGTMNYKIRTEDLTQADVTDVTSAKTMAVSNGGTTLTASGAVFLNWMAGQWIRIPYSNTNANSGDNQWYQIDTITSSTVATLKNPYTGNSVTAGAFTIGQVPILPEDYQDLPLFRMGVIYYTTRFPDPTRAQFYQGLWDKGMEALDIEFGSKTTQIVLSDTDSALINPNLFQASITQN